MLEYLLITLVVITIFIAVARPGFTKLADKMKNGFKSGFFSDDKSGSGFYYYPIK